MWRRGVRSKKVVLETLRTRLEVQEVEKKSVDKVERYCT